MKLEKIESGISFNNESNEIELDQMKIKIDKNDSKEEQKIELESSLED